jgi:hypothetical protein
MTAPRFPAVGHVYETDFVDWAFQLHFESETRMTLTSARGSFKGAFETVQISVTPIRSGVFLVCWQEADKTTVVHLNDFKNGVVHTRVTEPNGVFIQRSGILKKVR